MKENRAKHALILDSQLARPKDQYVLALANINHSIKLLSELYINQSNQNSDVTELVQYVKHIVYDILLKNPLDKYKLTDEFLKDSIRQLAVCTYFFIIYSKYL